MCTSIYLLLFTLACAAATTVDTSYDNYQYSSTGQEENTTEEDSKGEESSISPTASSYNSVVIHTPPQHSAITRSTEPDMTTSEHGTNLKIHYKRPPPNFGDVKPPYRLQYQSRVPNVHPAVMQKLMKQQPQTFDYQSDPEPEEQERKREKPDFRNQMGDNSEDDFPRGYNRDNDQRAHKFRYIRYGGRNSDKGFRYSPNSLQHDKPSSFKVGYSIGFGNQQNGHMRPPNMHNIPTSFHMEGKNTVWKQLGPGVEMSEQIQSRNPFRMYGPKQNSETPSIYYVKTDNADTPPTAGRMTFDHEHALGQSNSFDFTNAIDPTSGNHIGLSNGAVYASNYRPQDGQETREGKYAQDSSQNAYTPKLVNLNLFQGNVNRPDLKNTGYPLGQNIYAGNFGYSSYPVIQQMYIQGKNGQGQMVPAILIPLPQGTNQGQIFPKYFGGPQPFYGMPEQLALASNVRNQNFPRPYYQQGIIMPGNRLLPQLGLTQAPQVSSTVPLVLNPSNPDLYRYQREDDGAQIMMRSDDLSYPQSGLQREQKTLNYKSPQPAFLHILKSGRPARDLSHHTPILNTILEKVYNESPPKSLSGATIIVKET